VTEEQDEEEQEGTVTLSIFAAGLRKPLLLPPPLPEPGAPPPATACNAGAGERWRPRLARTPTASARPAGRSAGMGRSAAAGVQGEPGVAAGGRQARRGEARRRSADSGFLPSPPLRAFLPLPSSLSQPLQPPPSSLSPSQPGAAAVPARAAPLLERGEGTRTRASPRTPSRWSLAGHRAPWAASSVPGVAGPRRG
jgi:hypothetical protein